MLTNFLIEIKLLLLNKLIEIRNSIQNDLFIHRTGSAPEDILHKNPRLLPAKSFCAMI